MEKSDNTVSYEPEYSWSSLFQSLSYGAFVGITEAVIIYSLVNVFGFFDNVAIYG